MRSAQRQTLMMHLQALLDSGLWELDYALAKHIEASVEKFTHGSQGDAMSTRAGDPVMATPFYDSAPRTGLVIQVEMVETTQPGDVYRTYAPTGRRRGFIHGWRVPARVALWAMLLRQRLA